MKITVKNSTLSLRRSSFSISPESTGTFTTQLFTTAGTFNWTKPVGVREVVVECWGGGGAGGGCTLNTSAGGGGGGGAYSKVFLNYTSSAANITYTVGASAVGGTGLGLDGNPTTWGSGPEVTANGGFGGEAGLDATLVAGGGGAVPWPSGPPGDPSIFYGGGTGGDGNGTAVTQTSGGGGGGAGSTGFGNNASGATGGVAQTENGGAGGDGYTANIGGADGRPGNNYGAGGSGAYKVAGINRNGGTGAQGLIRINYR